MLAPSRQGLVRTRQTHEHGVITMGLAATAARAMLEGFALVGLDSEDLRVRAGISNEDLSDETAFLPDARFAALWRQALKVAQRDTLAFEVARALPLGTFGLVDYLVSSSRTIGEGLEALREYFGAVAGGMLLELDRSRRGRLWVRVHNVSAFELQHISDEFTLALILSRVRALANGAVHLHAIELSRGTPGPRRGAWEALWGAPLRFRQPVAGLCLEAGAEAVPLRSADARLQRLLRTTARATAAGQPSLLLVARSIIRRRIASGQLTETRVAHELALSTRSLQRRLRELDTSYRRLVDDVRRDEALRLIEEPEQPLTSIALALGFHELASFTRAFRRWTGKSPRQWVQGTSSPRLRETQK